MRILGRVLLPLTLAAALALSACSAAAPSLPKDEPLADNPPIFEAISDKAFTQTVSHEELMRNIETILSRYTGTVSITFRNLTDPADPGFDVHGDTAQTAASMIKLLVLAEVFDQVSSGILSLETLETIENDNVVGGSGIIQGMEQGTRLSLEDLVRYMIVDSDNTATNILIDMVGMDAVNEEAANLGLQRTELLRVMMDDSAAASGIENLMSSNDIATILQSIAEGSFYSADLSALALSFLENQNDSSGITAGLPEGVEFAHKTGLLTNVQNDGGIVEGSNPYVLVIMAQDMNNDQALALMAEVTQAIEASLKPSA